MTLKIAITLHKIPLNVISKIFSPILLAPGAFPHVQSVNEFRAFLIVTRELFATFTGHKLFQLVQLHFGFAMDTFIGSFLWDFSLSNFAVCEKKSDKKKKVFIIHVITTATNSNWWSDNVCYCATSKTKTVGDVNQKLNSFEIKNFFNSSLSLNRNKIFFFWIHREGSENFGWRSERKNQHNTHRLHLIASNYSLQRPTMSFSITNPMAIYFQLSRYQQISWINFRNPVELVYSLDVRNELENKSPVQFEHKITQFMLSVEISTQHTLPWLSTSWDSLTFRLIS